MANVIKPLTKEELEKIFDEHSLNVMEFFLKELALTKPEVLPEQNDVPIYAAQEYVEQWFVQALGAKPMGAGSFPIDILKAGKYGADIKSLSYKTNKLGEMTGSESGEASLGQKFDTDNSEETLDSLFKEDKRNKILDIWKEILDNKYQKAKEGELEDLPLYFFFILRGPLDFYILGAKVNTENVKNLKVDEDKTTENSVYVNGYITNELGSCKIYKAKKRMELRLRSKKWISTGNYIKFDMPQKRIEKDLRQLSVDGELENYLIKKFEIIDDKEIV